MNKETLGATILRSLGYIGEGVNKLAEGGVMYSQEPFGILYALTEKMHNTIKSLASKGYYVYAIISGKYILDGEDTMEATSYLCLQ